MAFPDRDRRLREFLRTQGIGDPSDNDVNRLRRWARRTTRAGLIALVLCAVVAYILYRRYGGLGVIPMAVVSAVVYGTLYFLSKRWGAYKRK